jgi:hypothetical protein
LWPRQVLKPQVLCHLHVISFFGMQKIEDLNHMIFTTLKDPDDPMSGANEYNMFGKDFANIVQKTFR